MQCNSSIECAQLHFSQNDFCFSKQYILTYKQIVTRHLYISPATTHFMTKKRRLRAMSFLLPNCLSHESSLYRQTCLHICSGRQAGQFYQRPDRRLPFSLFITIYIHFERKPLRNCCQNGFGPSTYKSKIDFTPLQSMIAKLSQQRRFWPCRENKPIYERIRY